MNASSMTTSAAPAYELRFQSLLNAGHAFAFPCDACGRVDMDTLSEITRNNYLYARVVVGREFAHPVVRSQAFPAERSLTFA